MTQSRFFHCSAMAISAAFAACGRSDIPDNVSIPKQNVQSIEVATWHCEMPLEDQVAGDFESHFGEIYARDGCVRFKTPDADVPAIFPDRHARFDSATLTLHYRSTYTTADFEDISILLGESRLLRGSFSDPTSPVDARCTITLPDACKADWAFSVAPGMPSQRE
jgi:hypothetical protein